MLLTVTHDSPTQLRQCILQIRRLQSRQSSSHSQVQLLPRLYSRSSRPVQFSSISASSMNLVRNNGAKSGPLDLNPWVGLATFSDNFGADVLALSIAIGPDHKYGGSAGFLTEVGSNCFAVLFQQRSSAYSASAAKRTSLHLLCLLLTLLSFVSTGASNSAKGSQLPHCLYLSPKSFSVKCPLTLVTVISTHPSLPPQLYCRSKLRQNLSLPGRDWKPPSWARMDEMLLAIEGFSATQRIFMPGSA